MLYTKFKVSLLVPKKIIIEGLYHIWTWKSPRSCDPKDLNKFLSQHPMASNGIVFFRKRSLKMLNLSDLGQKSLNDSDLRLS